MSDVFTYEVFMQAAEAIRKQEYDPANDPFVCTGGLDGYFMSFQLISPLRPRVVHPDTYRALQAMSQEEYDRRMEEAKARVQRALDG